MDIILYIFIELLNIKHVEEEMKSLIKESQENKFHS